MTNNLDLMTLERQDQIVALVNDVGRITVAELSERFGVSETTIRRDLSSLAARYLIRRTHGGVMRVGTVATTEIPILLRQGKFAAEKDRIGAATAGLIQNGETLLVAGGSTGLAVAQHLSEHSDLTVITESLLVVQELLRQGQHRLIMLGGSVDPDEQAVRGTLARQMLEQLSVDKVIIGARAVSLARGISAETPEEAEFLRAFLNCGEHRILVTDSSKFHLSALVTLAPLNVINTLVTDNNLDDETAQQIRELDIYLITV
ncbi:MAG: DeoR/GlpR transcriptional regulator [Chloroflexi bacterium]|nr:MAG: DeoR/GlpR transcriptional regulator [Chloroflexota bacterium]